MSLIEPILLAFLRTLGGLGAPTPPLTCADAAIQTLKRNDHAGFRRSLVIAD